MKKKKVKARDPFAKSLENNLFRQRIVESKKKKTKQFNWKNKKHLSEDFLRIILGIVFKQSSLNII